MVKHDTDTLNKNKYWFSWLISESIISFLKYADDVVIGHPCRDAQGHSIISNALKYFSEWSGQNGLNLNPNKCVQCTFSLIGNAVTGLDLKAIINHSALSTVDTVTLGFHLRETQSGPVMLKMCTSILFCKEGYQHLLSIFANLLRRV